MGRKYQSVKGWRYACASFDCTVRVNPQGVRHQQISHRVMVLAVMLYVLGLSYREVPSSSLRWDPALERPVSITLPNEEAEELKA